MKPSKAVMAGAAAAGLLTGSFAVRTYAAGGFHRNGFPPPFWTRSGSYWGSDSSWTKCRARHFVQLLSQHLYSNRELPLHIVSKAAAIWKPHWISSVVA